MKQQTNKTEPVLTEEEKKENKTHSPQIPALLYFAFKSHLQFPIRLKGTHQVKIDTHSPFHSDVEHKKLPKKAESDSRITNYDQHNRL